MDGALRSCSSTTDSPPGASRVCQGWAPAAQTEPGGGQPGQGWGWDACLRIPPSRNGQTPPFPEHPCARGQGSWVRVWDRRGGGESPSVGAQGCPSSAAGLSQTPLFHLTTKPT